jgi:hypothetical protein
MLDMYRLTVCVWAGVNSVWEQEKLKARKMLENAAESPTQVQAVLGGICPQETYGFS